MDGLDLPQGLDAGDAERLMALQLMEAIERLGVSEQDWSEQDTLPFSTIRGRLQ